MKLSGRTKSLAAMVATFAMLLVASAAWWRTSQSIYLYDPSDGYAYRLFDLNATRPSIQIAYKPPPHEGTLSPEVNSIAAVREDDGSLRITITLDWSESRWAGMPPIEDTVVQLVERDGEWFLYSDNLRSGHEPLSHRRLLRIPDPDFAAALEGDRETAQRLAQRFEGHPLLALVALEDAFEDGDLDRAETLLAQHRAAFEGAGGFLAAVHPIYEELLPLMRRAKEEETVDEMLREHVSGFPPGTQGRWSQSEADAIMASIEPGMLYRIPQTGLLRHEARRYIPNFLSVQVFVKIRRVRTDFLLLQGRIADAERMATEDIRFGTLLMEEPAHIGRLIGMAVVAIANAGMEHVLLSGYNDADELEAAWGRFDALWREGVASDTGESDRIWPHLGLPLGGEPDVRRRTSRMRVALLREAAAARQHLLATGEFPASAQDVALLEEGGRSPDLFDPANAPVRWTLASPDELRVYTLGPDGTDGGTAVAYDPTNGTRSAGDIWVSVPRERYYPFPSRADLPRTRNEFLARFPRGLPPDPFADTRGRPYAVMDTRPLGVFSFGPQATQRMYGGEVQRTPAPGRPVAWDGNEWVVYRSNPRVGPYDPTNGTISAGVVFGVIE